MDLSGCLEFDLLVRCAGPRPDATRPVRSSDLVDAGFGWTRFVELAVRHGVTPLVARNAQAVFGDALPTDIAEALAVNRDTTWTRNRTWADELTNILGALERCGIPAIPFKGPVLAATAYGDLSLRTFRDLDFLIRETDTESALECLAGIGYDTTVDLSPARRRALFRYAGQLTLSRPGGEIVIEPHWSLAPAVLAVPFDYGELWANATPASFDGATVASFAPEDQLIVLSVHGCKEGWWRLQWICDIAWLIDANPALDWQVALRRAARQGCLRMVLLAVSLAHRVTATPLSPSVAAALERDGTVQRLGDEVVKNFPDAADSPAPLFRVSSFRLRMRERLRDRALYVFRTITMPRGAHLRMIAMPDALFALYYPVKLIHDYLLLPLWLTVCKCKDERGSTRTLSPEERVKYQEKDLPAGR